MEEMDSLLVRLAESSAGSEEARLQLYRAIDNKGKSDDNEDSSNKSRAFENRRGAILSVLVKDACQHGCAQIPALELLSHLCAMASTWKPPSFQPYQASSLWRAVAKVLHDEASLPMVRVTTLFMVSKQTLEPRLVEPSIEQIAPAVARSMAHASTVVRNTSAKAVHALLGAAPGAMALCTRRTAAADSEEESSCWLRGLLRLCLDGACGVRESALAAAERAVSSGSLRGNKGIAAWVLGKLRDGTLEGALRRVMLGNAESRSPPSPAPPAAAELPAKGSNDHSSSSSAKASADGTPKYAKEGRVKHAMRAWAVYLSLADLNSLVLKQDGGKTMLLNAGTSMFLWLCSGFDEEGRVAVRIQALEVWEMFTKSIVAQCSLDPEKTHARRVAHMLLKFLAKRIVKETVASVRGLVLSATASLAASFPPALFRHLWESRGKHKGLAEVLHAVAKGDKSVIARHHCALLLANLLPSFSLEPADSHPSLREARINLAKAMPRLLSTLESLMESNGEGQGSAAPVPEEVASTINAMAPPPPSSSIRSGGSGAAARLELLPTEGLIANAWCGLAFWAMERAAAAPATATASPAGPAGAGAGATDGSNSDKKDEDGSGKGKGKGKEKEKEKPNDGSATAAAEAGQPLVALLRWLLGGATEPSNRSGSDAATNAESAAGGSSGAESAGLPPATPVTPTEQLVRWKASLLGALIRGLSRRLVVSEIRTAPGTETDGSGAKGHLGSAQEPPEQAWLDTLVDVSSLYSGGSPACPECALAGDVVRDAILRERRETNDGDGGSNGATATGGEQDGTNRQAKPPLLSRFPLWLVLLEAVLRGNCACNKRGGSGRRCHPASLLPKVFLTEALALSPSGWSARFLESLYKTVFLETEGGDQGTRATEPEEGNIHGSGVGAWGVPAAKRRREKQSSALTVLGHAWRAEASRVLLAWKSCRLPRPNPSSPGGSTACAGVDGSVQEAGLLHSGGAAGAPPQQEFSDELRQDTGSTLLLLLRTASSLLSHTAPGAACNRSRGRERAGAAAVGDACAPGGSTAANDGEQGEGTVEALVSNQNLEEGGAQGWSQDARRLAAAKAMLGAESAALWSEIFEARSKSRTHAAGGFTRLVKHLAKACGSCALSVEEPEEEAVVGRMSGISDGNAESLAGAWGGLGFSQTQPQQDKDKIAPTSEGEKPAPAARNTLAPPPPFFSLPVLAAAALALLTAAPEEAKVKERDRAWKAGLATLAWTLTSTSAESIPPLPQPPLQQQPRSISALFATTVAEEGAIAVAGICRCLSTVRSTLATAAAAGTVGDSSGVNWSLGTTFPLDEASLASVSQLLATALGRSYAVSTAPAAAQGASPGKVVGAAEGSRVACAAVAAVPAVRSEVGSLVVCVLSAVRSVRPEVLEGSPGLQPALSPALEAVLDLPASSDGNALQSSLLDTWNATFGKLNLRPPSAASSGAGDRRTAWHKAFRPSLLRRLSELSQRREVKLPPGIALPTPSGTAAAGPSRRQDGQADGHKGSESALGGDEGAGETSAQSAAVGDLRGAASGMGRGHASPGFAGNGGVAGVLSGEGARRSFLRTAASSSPPSQALATPRKRAASPTSTSRLDGAAAGSGGSAEKFVRVVGSGRGSASRTPTRRAAVTTHTALDGSQAMNPWEGGSQLPDTDPDSVPDLVGLEEEEKSAVPLPPKNVLPPPSTPSSEHGGSSTSTASTKSPEGAGGSPGKRALEDAESETVDPNKTTTPPSGGVARGDAGMPSPPAKTPDRRVRPKTTANNSSGGDDGGAAIESSDTCQSERESVGGGASAGTAAAAAAEAARTHATMLAISRAEVEQRSRRDETGCEDGETSERTPSFRAPSTGQDVGKDGGVEALLQDVRSLAQRVEAARTALSPEQLQQLQEVGSLFQKIGHS